MLYALVILMKLFFCCLKKFENSIYRWHLIEQLKTLQYQEIIQNVFAGLHGKEK
jgi:hypothetical protein